MTTLVYEFDPEEFVLDDDSSTSPFWGLKKCVFQQENEYDSPIKLKYDICEANVWHSVRVINSFNDFKRQKTKEFDYNSESSHEDFSNKNHSNSLISDHDLNTSVLIILYVFHSIKILQKLCNWQSNRNRL